MSLAAALIFGAALTMLIVSRRSAAESFPFVSVRLADGLSCEIYVPSNLDKTRNHSLVFGSSAVGIGHDVLVIWREAADRQQWIVVGSNNFKNGPSDAKQHDLQLETLAMVLRDYPIDKTHVYAAGQSGGGMNAYGLLSEHPEIFRGVVINTGMMPHHLLGNAPFDPARYPRNKLAVMLASPKDFRYREMHEDRNLLEG
ncbi:MAG: prolyl oligopeptidase family serine peptidase, partial [Polyangiaceae bacterium]